MPTNDGGDRRLVTEIDEQGETSNKTSLLEQTCAALFDSGGLSLAHLDHWVLADDMIERLRETTRCPWT